MAGPSDGKGAYAGMDESTDDEIQAVDSNDQSPRSMPLPRKSLSRSASLSSDEVSLPPQYRSRSGSHTAEIYTSTVPSRPPDMPNSQTADFEILSESARIPPQLVEHHSQRKGIRIAQGGCAGLAEKTTEAFNNECEKERVVQNDREAGEPERPQIGRTISNNDNSFGGSAFYCPCHINIGY